MDIDDLEPRQVSPFVLGQTDLSMMSVEELNERVSDLKTEIERCEAMIASKQVSRADAESFFKK